jgi:hypothetical protein
MSKDRYGTGTDLRRAGGRSSSAQESFLDHFFWTPALFETCLR